MLVFEITFPCVVLLVLGASLGLSHRFQVEPQPAFGSKDELWETADSLGGGPKSGVRPRQQAKPEQRQGHDHA